MQTKSQDRCKRGKKRAETADQVGRPKKYSQAFHLASPVQGPCIEISAKVSPTTAPIGRPTKKLV